ncbi:tRNA pseudouridine(55) synthase TruB [soil metagenome]
MTQQELLDGQVLLIDKPLEWTSFQVIAKLRWIFKIRKIGHAGTLDPLATGLLIVCTGKFTKKINEYMGMEKEYTGTITLGATTPTYDLESEPIDFKPVEQFTTQQIMEATKPFTGPIQQIPPAHSAIQINGQRAYDLARQGKEVKLEPRSVTIQKFEFTGIELPKVYFKVVCSTGTYIRSLANDFGAALGAGGYLSSLRRTRIGIFNVADAKTPAEIEAEMANFKQSAVESL